LNFSRLNVNDYEAIEVAIYSENLLAVISLFLLFELFI